MNYAPLITLAGLVLSAVLWEGPADGPEPPPGPPPHEKGGPREEVAGRLKGYNYNPQGTYDSLMLATEQGVVQLNFPAELADQVAAIAESGTLTAEVRPERSEGAHRVYRLEKVTAGEKSLVLADEDAPPAELKGIIKSLNYGRHGETNGFVLENGDFVQLGPREAQRLRLEIGQELTAEGRLRKLPSGKQILRATTINGVLVVPPPPPHDGPAGGKGGPRGGPKGGPKGRPR